MTEVSSGGVRSADGTPIAWVRQGEGPSLVMVSAVMASRARTPQPGLPAALARHFSVLTQAVRDLGEILPDALVRVLPGHGHGVDDDSLVLAVRDFLTASAVPVTATDDTR